MDSKIVPVSSIAPEGWGPKEGGNATSPLHSRGSPKEGEQNQKSKPTLGVTMMHHATKRGFKDCPGFLNSTGRLGAKRGRKCYVTLAFSGVPNKGGQNQKSKPTLRVTMMPLGAPSITKYGSLVRPGTQIVALRAHCARTARALRLRLPPSYAHIHGTFALHSWGCFSQVPQMSSFTLLGIGNPFKPVKAARQTDTVAQSSKQNTKKRDQIHALIQTVS